MIDKIQSLMERRQELSEAIAQPEIIQDFPRYQGYLKELSAIEPIALHYQKLQTVEKHLSEARELLADPDLAPEAEQELRGLSAERESLLSDLKLMLVPPDPLDDRNVIMELRAGVGGEEAALFAGDLLPGIFPKRIAQRRAFRNEGRNRGLLIRGSGADKNVLLRFPRKQANVPLHLLGAEGDEIHHHVEGFRRDGPLRRRLVGHIQRDLPGPLHLMGTAAAIDQRQIPSCRDGPAGDRSADDARSAQK